MPGIPENLMFLGFFDVPLLALCSVWAIIVYMFLEVAYDP